MTIPTTIPALLRAAAGEITTRGWWQHDYLGDDGEVCLIGALRAAAGAHPLREPEEPDAHDLLGAALADLALRIPADVDEDPDPEVGLGLFDTGAGAAIADWNDADGRTADQVTTLLHTVAADLDRPAAAA
ncbi:hypothetical protein FF36_05980 [Frankia torreyi]|uniref:Uncharacterized protein n=2 Tax=Frankia TaxID=1854 RepID=A0A0D8B6K8_9ACTN|nr:hypothetical protein [Frankia torreyi]KJE19725.1 hypothetical protein FF36_05980 [Frankia torreyi]